MTVSAIKPTNDVINNNIENRFEYDASIGQIFAIWILNFFLSIITIGIYSFWGKTKMRKYMANSFSLLGDRFEYNGTGGELFRGFLKALPIIIIIYLPFIIWDQEENPWITLMFIPIIFLVFMAIYGALRYRLSRTTWRGVRGKLTGSAFCFARKSITRNFLNIITFGLLIPSSDIKIYKYIAENTHFGNTQVKFDGNTKPLFIINLITLFLAIPTIGVSRIWYSAALTRHKYAHTIINNLRFKSTYTGSSLLGLYAVNLLIIIFTLGLGTPIIIQRNFRYFSEHMFIIGNINTSGIIQSDQKLGTDGEGLEEVFGLDSGIM
jgi:uncharacterized membrane protein YjgN (DUF898 family)